MIGDVDKRQRRNALRLGWHVSRPRLASGIPSDPTPISKPPMRLKPMVTCSACGVDPVLRGDEVMSATTIPIGIGSVEAAE